MKTNRQHSCGTVLPAIGVFTGNECLGMDPYSWLRSVLSPAATVTKWIAEVEAVQGCNLQPGACGDSSGYEKEPATLLWHCAACHLCPCWRGTWNKCLLTHVSCEHCGYGGKVGIAEVKARLQFATWSLWRLIWVCNGCGNTPVALCWLPFASLLARSVLK